MALLDWGLQHLCVCAVSAESVGAGSIGKLPALKRLGPILSLALHWQLSSSSYAATELKLICCHRAVSASDACLVTIAVARGLEKALNLLLIETRQEDYIIIMRAVRCAAKTSHIHEITAGMPFQDSGCIGIVA